jgi:putative addiction module component (TIGR02574 family)
MMTMNALRTEAMALPPQDRARLAEELLASLDELSEMETGQLWLEEAARRARELDDGLVERIPAELVHQEAEALLR